MPSYKIIRADLKEYGPVSEEQIRQWIIEGRVDSETKLQVEGSGEWKQLADVPELAAPLKGNGSRSCPNCGEPFEDGFDSCWKCGTHRDGSPAKEFTPVADAAEGATGQCGGPCPKCGSSDVRRGELLPVERGVSVVFRPARARLFSLSFRGGVVLSPDGSSACLDCGLVWSQLQPAELKEFISKQCRGSDREDSDGLMSEAVRLESEGNMAGALAKYEAVTQGFPGTDAARDAEASIRRLKATLG